MRPDPGQDHADAQARGTRLRADLQQVHRARPADGQARQQRQGHRLGYHPGVRRAQEVQLPGAGRGCLEGHALARGRHLRLRLGHAHGAGNQRRGGAQVVERAVEEDRHRPPPPVCRPPRGQDHLPRHRRPAAQDHHRAHLVRHRVGDRVLHRGLHQHPRAHPVPYPDRSCALLPGPRVVPRLRRRLLRLQAAGSTSRPTRRCPTACATSRT